jgi:two-component sensor histidine kinase
MLAEIFDTLVTSSAPTRNENHVLTKDGRQLLVEWHGRPVYGEDGQFRFFLGVGIDVTERKQMEEQLRTSLAEKEMLIREVHHRVKNSMQVISSLLRLQLRQTEDPEARGFLQDTENRVAAMAMVHQQLYDSRNLARIDFGPHVRKLVSHLFGLHGAASKAITFQADAQDISLGIDLAVPCSLIVNELVSNALKHAFPDGREGTIRVSLRRNGGRCKLVVADDGVGFPPGVDFRRAKTMGLRVVAALAGQLQGSIHLDEGGGSAFTIDFLDLDSMNPGGQHHGSGASAGR